MLEARDLTMNLGTTPILRGVHLTLRPGVVTGILSLEKIETRVLLSVLSLQEQPTSGTVSTEDEVQLIPGTSRLFGNLSILDNLMVGLTGSRGRNRLGQAIDRVRPLLEEFGLERSLETKVRALTIPEQQVVSAVLFLIQEAPVLLVRDVFGNLTLDQYRLFVTKLRERAAAGRAVAVVPDHAAQLFDLCDEAVLLRNGRCVLTAPIADLDVEEVRNVLNNTEYLIVQTLENKFHQFQTTISEPEILFERALKVLANFCALPQGFVLSEGPAGSTVLTLSRSWKGAVPSPTAASGLRQGALNQGKDGGRVHLDARPFTWSSLQPGDPSGALLFLEGEGPREFPFDETVALFRQSAALLADRVHQEAAARDRELQTIRLGKEMDIARNIQSSILPRKSQLAGYTIASHMETATEVGGDSYDLLATPLGNFISVGDVSGHGLPSGIMALIEMAALHGVIQTHMELKAEPVPSIMYDLVNRVLCEINRDRIGSDKFMTKVLLVENGGVFRHAGTHEIGLLYSRSRNEMTELSHMVDNTGFLGVSEYVDSSQSLGRFVMEEGDFLLLYTDGLIEAKNGKDDQYGIDRVKGVLLRDPSRSPEALLTALRADLLAFAEDGDRRKHGGRLADDLTLMLLRRDLPSV